MVEFVYHRYGSVLYCSVLYSIGLMSPIIVWSAASGPRLGSTTTVVCRKAQLCGSGLLYAPCCYVACLMVVGVVVGDVGVSVGGAVVSYCMRLMLLL